MTIELDVKNVHIHHQNTVYKGHNSIEVVNFSMPSYAGGILGPISREVVLRTPAVAVLLVDELREKFVLVEQFRPGCWFANKNPWTLEVVAGLIDSGSPIETAYRESQEEAGAHIQKCEFIQEYMPTPGSINELTHLFCGWVDSTSVAQFAGLPQEHEDIKVCVKSFTEVFTLLEQGKILSGATLVLLLWYKNRYTHTKIPKTVED